jgi:hypothetical protein
MEDNLKKIIKEDLKKSKCKKTSTFSKTKTTTSKKNGRQPQKNGGGNGKRPQKNGRRHIQIKWRTKQTTKINLNGCDTIVNSPNFVVVELIVLLLLYNMLIY